MTETMAQYKKRVQSSIAEAVRRNELKRFAGDPCDDVSHWFGQDEKKGRH